LKYLNFCIIISFRDNISKKNKVDIVVVYGFHPFERYAFSVGEALKDLKLKDVEVLNFTPKSVGKSYQNYWDWFRVGAEEQIRRSTIGRKELRDYIMREYRKVFVIELHDDPGPASWDAYISFPSWNIKLKKVINRFSKELRKIGYIVHPFPCTPRGRVSYHSTVIEYFPNGAYPRKNLKKTDGLLIVEKFIGKVRSCYLLNSV